MKDFKFILKFVNHDSKTVSKYIINIRSNIIKEWDHKWGQQNYSIEEINKKMEWEHKLKDKVLKLIKEKYFANEHGQFGDYRLMQEKMSLYNKIVNINTDGNVDDITFKEDVMVAKKVWKFHKGHIGSSEEDRTAYFNYNRTSYFHEFLLTHEDNNKEIDIINLASFEISGEKIQHVNRHEHKQSGGNYQDKYLKYKSKYLQAKKMH